MPAPPAHGSVRLYQFPKVLRLEGYSRIGFSVRPRRLGRVAPSSIPLRLGESPAHRRELVAVGIAHVSGVEIGAVVRAKPRRTLGRAALRERCRVEPINLAPGARHERHHRAVAGARRASVERRTEPQCELTPGFLVVHAPAVPVLPLGLGHVAALEPERAEHGIVEAGGARWVVRAERDVSEHGASLRCRAYFGADAATGRGALSDGAAPRARSAARASRT